MVRLIDPTVARRTAAHMETLERELSAQMAAAVTLLRTVGGTTVTAARARASTNWWGEEAARLRLRADAVDMGNACPVPETWGPTFSAPDPPRDLVLADLSKLEERRTLLSTHLDLLNGFLRWVPGEPLQSLRSSLTRAVARLDRAVADRRAWADRNLLFFDPSGDGRIVEVIGDLKTARHVVVLVPGMGNGLSSYERTLRVDALRLAERLGDTDTAVVAWLGYDPPDTIVGAISRGPARRGAAALGDFVRRLGPVHTTVIAHSYGSLVAGLAARQGLLVPDELVFIGSPGVGADNVAELGLPPSTTVWSGLTLFDPIRLARPDCMDPSPRCSTDLVFGTDPHGPMFGAKVFATGEGPLWNAHSAYYRTGSLSLENLAHIALDEDVVDGRA